MPVWREPLRTGALGLFEWFADDGGVGVDAHEPGRGDAVGGELVRGVRRDDHDIARTGHAGLFPAWNVTIPSITSQVSS